MSEERKTDRTPEEVEAEVRKLRAEAAKAEAEARVAELEAEAKAIDLAKKREEDEIRRTNNRYHRIHTFDGAVTDQTVKACIDQLDVWRRLHPGQDITVRFYSPGGDVIAGMYLFDYLEGLKRAGHTLYTEAYGYAASMAGILLQAGSVRRIGRESYVLIHEIQFAVRGKVGEVEDEMEFVRKISDRVLDIFAEGARRAAAHGTATQPLSRKQFERRWKRKDWWLSSDECLRYGIVDEVI
jgi:ATP-dependent Clp protease protease subunit